MIRDRIISGVLAVVLAVGGVVGGTAVSRMMFGGEAWAKKSASGGLSCSGVDCVSTGAQETGLSDGANTDIVAMIPTVINAILYAVGILAVVMVIWGGVQYSLSAGDTAKVTKAKNTILYGLIGMVIAILSYAIVNFVLSKVTG